MVTQEPTNGIYIGDGSDTSDFNRWILRIWGEQTALLKIYHSPDLFKQCHGAWGDNKPMRAKISLLTKPDQPKHKLVPPIDASWCHARLCHKLSNSVM
ncbi:MAG: hypothetical protein DSM106950_06355 [Stigonema ocellatum SAG 48.90 = DSM 106950]|nr:hypothetical protein [Stigonema ocellatum SAG 48.90 = DSM 106950]